MTEKITAQNNSNKNIKKYFNNKYYYYLVLISRIIMGTVWIYAGLKKILGNYLELLYSIQSYDLFSDTVSIFISNTLPICEIILGLLILLGIFVKPIGKISLFLLILFVIGLTQALLRGLSIDCGCFGENSENNGSQLDMILIIFRDIIFIVLTSIFTWSKQHKYALYPGKTS